MENLPSRIAIIYDWVNKWGGAEQVLLALHDIFPDAPLLTSVYNPSTAGWAKVFPSVISTFLNQLPKAKTAHEIYPWLTPLAFESLSLNDFDAVISVTSADAKGIVTQPSTFHLCYCLTPTRYLWSHESDYRSRLNPLAEICSRPVYRYLKAWDRIASRRPDAYISISRTVQSRLQTYYSVSSDIVYPPVNLAGFSKTVHPPAYSGYFLHVGRLVGYKHPRRVVEAFRGLDARLIVVGTGESEAYLRSIAPPNVQFTGFVSQEELVGLYRHAQGLIFFHEEDFGLVPIEAMASGIPVIALNRGGAAETVVDNVTGILVDSPSVSALRSAIADFSRHKFDRRRIVARAAGFSSLQFRKKFVKVFAHQWMMYKNTYTS